jgi:hypothetical protein
MEEQDLQSKYSPTAPLGECAFEERLKDIADLEEFCCYLSDLIDREVEDDVSVNCTNFLYSILLGAKGELKARVDDLDLVRLEGVVSNG